jgi:DNA-binding IclR family transcriptional regulator
MLALVPGVRTQFTYMNYRGVMVKSADRVMQILEAIGSSEEGKTHGELASSLNIPKSSLSLLLANLVDREYVSLSGRDRRYALGPQVLVLAGRYLSRLDIVRLGHPVLEKITRAVDESAEIAIKRGHEVIIISKEDRSQPLSRMIQLGDRAPIYATAAGKAILAHLSDEEIDQYLSSVELRPITQATITSPEVLWRELHAIRSGALARSREELHEGITAMACPVFDLYGRVVASIVLPIPTIRFTSEKERRAEEVLLHASFKLSHQLGFDTASHARYAKTKGSNREISKSQILRNHARMPRPLRQG